MHFQVVCRLCRAVISQCRCPAPDKPIRYADVPCVKCQASQASCDEVVVTPAPPPPEFIVSRGVDYVQKQLYDQQAEELRRHVEAASVFQNGEALGHILRPGNSIVLDGLKWLLKRERERIDSEYRCQHEVRWTGEVPEDHCHKCGYNFMKRPKLRPAPQGLVEETEALLSSAAICEGARGAYSHPSEPPRHTMRDLDWVKKARSLFERILAHSRAVKD